MAYTTAHQPNSGGIWVREPPRTEVKPPPTATSAHAIGEPWRGWQAGLLGNRPGQPEPPKLEELLPDCQNAVYVRSQVT